MPTRRDRDQPPEEKQNPKKHVDNASKTAEPIQKDGSVAKKADPKDGNTEESSKDVKPSSVPSKRKAATNNEPSKAPRRSARGAQQPSIDPVKMLQFLLSPASADLCRPKDEIEDLKVRGGDIITYSSSTFTPFQELVCAVILSRPISHALGIRSIRTIFNDPWNFTTPKALREAGPEGRRKALDEARTQHRQKTAEELGLLADALVEKLGDNEDDVGMEKVRRDGEHDADKELEIIKTSVKGMGKTGIDIFRRRIQGVWPACYPFIDQKTSASLAEFGLPDNAEDLRQLLDQHWDNLKIKDIEGENEDGKKRKAFVRLLEHAVGAHLEGKVDEVKAQADSVS